MKNFWKIVMLTVLCVSLLCGVTAMAEADRFQFEKTNLTVFEGNTLELSLIRQGNCAADGELTFVSGRENIATVDENGVVTGLTKGAVDDYCDAQNRETDVESVCHRDRGARRDGHCGERNESHAL